MVLYDALYETEETIDTTFHEQITIGLGGTTTIRLQNGEAIDLVESAVNYYTKNIYGKKLEDIKLGFETYHIKSTIIGLDEIAEIITEGFIITPENKANILKLIKEVKVIKIPQRD